MSDIPITPPRRLDGAVDTRTLRAVALPAEHGGWGLLAEPLLLGILLAPTAAGAAVVAGAVCAFLARHPARLAVGDLRRGTLHPRTRLAASLAAANLVGAAAGLATALLLSEGRLAIYLLPVWPAAFLYLAFDLRMRGREMVAELAGALSLSAAAGAVAVAGGWPLSRAWPLWLLAGGRAVAGVIEVRTRLRRRRGQAAGATVPVLVHVLFATAAAVAAWLDLMPAPAALVPLALLARSAWHLRPGAAPRAPQQVGWGEVRAGVLAVGAWVAAYRIFG